MGSIADYKPPQSVITIKGSKDFIVHGLALDDIAQLVTMNAEDIVLAVQYWQQAKTTPRFESSNAGAFIIHAAKSFPMLMAQVISTASDGDGTPEQCRHLPAGVQMAALTEIARLTVEDMGGLKNSLAVMKEMAMEMLQVQSLSSPHAKLLLDSVMGFGRTRPSSDSTDTASPISIQ